MATHEYKVGDVIRTVTKLYKAPGVILSKTAVNATVVVSSLPVDTLCIIEEIVDFKRLILVSPLNNRNQWFKASERDFLPAPESARILFGD